MRPVTEKQMSTAIDKAHLQLKLSYRPPFDWPSLSQFLQARAIPGGVEAISSDGYRRTVQIGQRMGIIEVRPVGGASHLRLQTPPELAGGLPQISERVRNLFDLRAAPLESSRHLKQDKLLKSEIEYEPCNYDIAR